jgi:DNA-binding PucR family transcriptional regulator
MLHLHTNTVAYRIARIEAISALDLGDPDDRLVAHVAVKIIESQGSAE